MCSVFNFFSAWDGGLSQISIWGPHHACAHIRTRSLTHFSVLGKGFRILGRSFRMVLRDGAPDVGDDFGLPIILARCGGRTSDLHVSRSQVHTGSSGWWGKTSVSPVTLYFLTFYFIFSFLSLLRRTLMGSFISNGVYIPSCLWRFSFIHCRGSQRLFSL